MAMEALAAARAQALVAALAAAVPPNNSVIVAVVIFVEKRKMPANLHPLAERGVGLSTVLDHDKRSHLGKELL